MTRRIGAARPSSGQVRIAGLPPESQEARRRLGYLPELPQLPATVTPRELLALHARLHGVPSRERKPKVDALLARVELASRADHRIGTFSKGMQQRVGLALALIGSPEVLILDEPMSGLDPMGRKLVRDLIREQARAGCTVFFSSHVLPDVEALCDGIAVLARGRLLLRGTVQELLEGSAHGVELRFRCDGDVPGVAARLGAVTAHGASHQLLLPPGSDGLAAANELAAAGCIIEQLEPARPPLEEHIVALLRQQGIQEAS
ncbi:MAG: ABC transporter ATP-binding protein [Myxococcota bacterium]